ncbi:MAG: hypothetical protein NUW01_02025 [Gemmatimonadaceae bacterium]|nr:hypothetical protein [Gemmatimonadaceae bacterium]
MADVLTDRASLARGFYRLTATSNTNPALIEHDSTSLEAVYQFLQYGLWDAQEYMIDSGMTDRWVTTSSALSFSGADSTDGGRYVSLPSDFLRLAGDEKRSALRYPTGQRWGVLGDFDDRHRYRGNVYWLQNEKLWVAPGASPPSTLVMDYHHQLATLADSTTVDFPTQHRALIVAYAAERASNDAWLPGGMEQAAMISANLLKRQREAKRRARRTDGPKKMKRRASAGTHWW